ncbi:hypothetical protein BC938DRAFT_477692 [Jimgerdemannia flammicorona]|uniref:Uncharacterized protein n=1 Tax=Jimgerdemannia flammicorona TaxID=994334 RepID=A0A433P890_9FUNG|nr:hypothetical protein BC938DRAFT_477692 [Jimgerdemannia flammicorona]
MGKSVRPSNVMCSVLSMSGWPSASDSNIKGMQFSYYTIPPISTMVTLSINFIANYSSPDHITTYKPSLQITKVTPKERGYELHVSDGEHWISGMFFGTGTPCQ